MEFLVTAPTPITYENKLLNTATKKIYRLAEGIRKNWYSIAHIIADVDKTGCYKDDGFDTVHAWTEKTFGIKKSASYTLLKIGSEYTREILDKTGRVIGYQSNLVEDGEKDFSKTQIEKMLPLGHDVAEELVTNGEVNADMTAKEISSIVKSKLADENETEESETDEEVAEVAEESEVDEETAEVVEEKFIHVKKTETFEDGTAEITVAIDIDDISKLEKLLSAYIF